MMRSEFCPISGDLFADPSAIWRPDEAMAPGAMLLHGYAREQATQLIDTLQDIASQAPFRHMATPGGFRMSVAITNCGAAGWTSDAHGYRYTSHDPESGRAWPAMPPHFARLAADAAARAGYPGFAPDACLINRYMPGARLSLHQDRNERDFAAPIVSVSLGLPAVFLFGGSRRSDRPRRFALEHGDVVVWGGPSRLAYHGVAPLRDDIHPATGPWRFNLTFRQAQ